MQNIASLPWAPKMPSGSLRYIGIDKQQFPVFFAGDVIINDIWESLFVLLSSKNTGSLGLADQIIAEMFVETMDPVTLEVSPSMILEMIHFHKLCRSTVSVHDEDGGGGRQHVFRATSKVDFALLHVAVGQVGSCLAADAPGTSQAKTKNECSSLGSMDRIVKRMLMEVKAEAVLATEKNAHSVWALLAELSRLLPQDGDNDKLQLQQISAVESF
eukprot:GEMP01098680.1.p1 GENE.GEMP01098680.1~~GEMP01098680.1.p1  ORF type:complete len:215 (+),score=46.03 GEMP01098680.1:104-748(+)